MKSASPAGAFALAILFLCGLLAFTPSGAGVKKTPIPDKAAQEKSFTLVLDIFKEDFEKAEKSPEEKVKLAGVLMQQGRESRDDVANRYVLFREALGLASGAGDFHLTFQIIDELGRDFAVDPIDMKSKSLDVIVKNVPTKEVAKDLYDLLQPLISEAVEADQYESATHLATIAEQAARKSKALPLVSAAKKRQDEVALQAKSFSKQAAFLDRLKTNPNDAEANLELGRYFSLFKGRWERGLAYLAKGKDPALSPLAEEDLKEPKTGKLQLDLADRYWEVAGKEKDPAQLQLQRRAMFWYDKALPSLAGLNRTKAIKRIDVVSAKLAGVAGVVTGPVGEIKKFEGHAQDVKAVAMSADGRHGASVGVDQTVRVWDLVGKDDKVFRGHSKETWGVAFHPTQRVVISASWDASARAWDIVEGKEVKRFTHPKDVNSVAVNREGTQVLVGCDDGSSYLWNYATGDEIKRFPGHSNFVYGVAFAPDGRHVASGSGDRTARVFDISTGALVKAFEGHADNVYFVAFSADSKYLFTTGDNFVRQWEIATGKEFRRYEGHTGRVLALAVSPDGRRLLTGGDDRTLRLWDTATGKLLETLKGHTESVTCVTFSRDGARALSGSIDRTVRLWGLPR